MDILSRLSSRSEILKMYSEISSAMTRSLNSLAMAREETKTIQWTDKCSIRSPRSLRSQMSTRIRIFRTRYGEMASRRSLHSAPVLLMISATNPMPSAPPLPAKSWTENEWKPESKCLCKRHSDPRHETITYLLTLFCTSVWLNAWLLYSSFLCVSSPKSVWPQCPTIV